MREKDIGSAGAPRAAVNADQGRTAIPRFQVRGWEMPEAKVACRRLFENERGWGWLGAHQVRERGCLENSVANQEKSRQEQGVDIAGWETNAHGGIGYRKRSSPASRNQDRFGMRKKSDPGSRSMPKATRKGALRSPEPVSVAFARISGFLIEEICPAPILARVRILALNRVVKGLQISR